MRKLLIALMLLVPLSAWGAERKVSQDRPQKADRKAEQEQLRTELKEDICFALYESEEARRWAFEMTRNSTRSTSPEAHYGRVSQIKDMRLNTLTQRYTKRFGEKLDVFSQCQR